MTGVLGIDSSTPFVAVASSAGGAVAAEASHPPDPQNGRPRHSELLLAEAEAAVEALGGWPHVGLIAVGVGPGSYTGLRIGISTARALAQARGLPIAGVVSLAALAAGIREADPEASRSSLAVLDARRGQAFAALYGPDGSEIWEPFVVSPTELAARVANLGESVSSAGDGSLRFRGQLEAAGATVAAPDDEVNRVAARYICALGQGAEPKAPEEIEPVYLRAPDAERWLERDN